MADWGDGKLSSGHGGGGGVDRYLDKRSGDYRWGTTESANKPDPVSVRWVQCFVCNAATVTQNTTWRYS